MAKQDELKRLLRNAAHAKGKALSETELNQAADALVKKAAVSRQELDVLSESITHDRQTFAVVDIGDINDILARKKD